MKTASALLVLSALSACTASLSQSQDQSQDQAVVQLRPSGGAALTRPIVDGNDNGVEDAIDISDGTSLDEDLNGIPDEIEAPGA